PERSRAPTRTRSGWAATARTLATPMRPLAPATMVRNCVMLKSLPENSLAYSSALASGQHWYSAHDAVTICQKKKGNGCEHDAHQCAGRHRRGGYRPLAGLVRISLRTPRRCAPDE